MNYTPFMVCAIFTCITIMGREPFKESLNNTENKKVNQHADLKKGEYTMVDIGLSEQQRNQVTNLLNKILANVFTLYVKTLNFHWRVRGPHFGPLHALFREQYEKLFDIVDDIAERTQTLGGDTYATMTNYLKHTTLKEHSDERPDDQGMLRHLLVDQETVIKQIRAAIAEIDKIGDVGTSNFLQDTMEKIEKMAWMVRSHIEK